MRGLESLSFHVSEVSAHCIFSVSGFLALDYEPPVEQMVFEIDFSESGDYSFGHFCSPCLQDCTLCNLPCVLCFVHGALCIVCFAL